MTPLHATRRRRALLAALALLAVAGCAGNDADTLLTPTGIRPLPTEATGGLEGFVRHDSTRYAGFEGTPYAPTVITLLRGATVLGADTVGGAKRGFRFERLPQGQYTLVARSHAFRPASLGPIAVGEIVRDAGDLYMQAAPESLSAFPLVIGTIPGFSVDEIFTFATAMEQNTAGLFTFPDTDPLTPDLTIPAGTYRFKFTTDESSSIGHLIGWGGDSSQVLTAPVIDSPVRFTTDAASEIKVTFPTTAVYAFTLDERRLTFSIQPLPSATAHAAARGRSARPAR